MKAKGRARRPILLSLVGRRLSNERAKRLKNIDCLSLQIRGYRQSYRQSGATPAGNDERYQCPSF